MTFFSKRWASSKTPPSNKVGVEIIINVYDLLQVGHSRHTSTVHGTTDCCFSQAMCPMCFGSSAVLYFIQESVLTTVSMLMGVMISPEYPVSIGLDLGLSRLVERFAAKCAMAFRRFRRMSWHPQFKTLRRSFKALPTTS